MKGKGWEKIYHTNTNLKKTSVSDKVDFKTISIPRDRGFLLRDKSVRSPER